MALLRSVSQGLRLSSFAARPKLYFQPLNQVRTVILKPVPAVAVVAKSHDDKNRALKRPLSPHLTVYKFQLTSMMSISHRITGLMLTAYMMGLAGSSFMATDIPHMVAAIQDMHIPSPIIFTSKFILAFPASYHLFNGIRHLVWDMGKGLTLKEVYMTGYATLAVTTLFTVYLASL